jgi:hypothetical protein
MARRPVARALLAGEMRQLDRVAAKLLLIGRESSRPELKTASEIIDAVRIRIARGDDDVLADFIEALSDLDRGDASRAETYGHPGLAKVIPLSSLRYGSRRKGSVER